MQMTNKRPASEYDREEWYNKAKREGADNYLKFEEDCLDGFDHDYGTVVEAIAACVLAYAEKLAYEQGITGYQADYIGLTFVREWGDVGKDVGFRILNYDNMLYPQYEYAFDKVIDHDLWLKIQEKAYKNLKEAETKTPSPSPRVMAHWRTIVNGKIPFGYKVKGM